MKICPSCDTKCIDRLKYCPKCNRYLGNVEIISERQYYKNAQTVQTQYYYNQIVECPYCHSTNTKKITNMSKAVHTAVFGLYAISRNSKQFHCNDCKADF